jgi:hypothetical protein
MLWSVIGTVLALLYLSATMMLYREANRHVGIWLPDLELVFAFLPAGMIFWWPFSGRFRRFGLPHICNPMRRWEFIIPTVLTNTALYYLLGYLVGHLCQIEWW